MTDEEKAQLEKETNSALGGDSDKKDTTPTPQQQSIGENAHPEASDSLKPLEQQSEEEKTKQKKLTEEQKAKLKEVEAQSEREKEEVSIY